LSFWWPLLFNEDFAVALGINGCGGCDFDIGILAAHYLIQRNAENLPTYSDPYCER